jgi:hypothetical protein
MLRTGGDIPGHCCAKCHFLVMQDHDTERPVAAQERRILLREGYEALPHGVEVKCHHGHWGLRRSPEQDSVELRNPLTHNRQAECLFVDHTPGLDVELVAELVSVPTAGTPCRRRPSLAITAAVILILGFCVVAAKAFLL